MSISCMSSFTGHPSSILPIYLLCQMLCLPECHETTITVCIILRLNFPHPKMFLRFISVATLSVIKMCVYTHSFVCVRVHMTCVGWREHVPCTWRLWGAALPSFAPPLCELWLALRLPGLHSKPLFH